MVINRVEKRRLQATGKLEIGLFWSLDLNVFLRALKTVKPKQEQ